MFNHAVPVNSICVEMYCLEIDMGKNNKFSEDFKCKSLKRVLLTMSNWLKHVVHLRNKFNIWSVHGIMITSGLSCKESKAPWISVWNSSDCRISLNNDI